jgi:hypothetical protein
MIVVRSHYSDRGLVERAHKHASLERIHTTA